jgi:signal transduction histidine kinase
MWNTRMRDAVAKVGGGIEAQFLTGLSHAEVLRRVRTLEPGTVIYTPGYFRDGAGRVFTPRQSIEAIAAASPVPVYGAFETQIGSGIVGGYVTSYRHEASAAGELAARLLDGASAAGMPPTVARRLPVVDWHQLRRFDVDEQSLPHDAVVQYRDATPWDKYRVQISTGVAIVVLQAVLICALLLQRARRRAAEHASSALAWRLLTAHEDERRRLARDLHDDVTQRLARLAIDASGLEGEATAVRGKVAARAVREDLVRLSEDVHALSYQLHPSVLDDLGLAEGIRAECTRLSRQESLAVDVDVSEVPGNVPREPSLCLFRIAQEALRNVVRHAHAKAVSVSLNREGRGLKLTVRDNGCGFDAARQNENASLGRISMRERARQVGGSVRVVSTPGGGTTVTAWVPIEALA